MPLPKPKPPQKSAKQNQHKSATEFEPEARMPSDRDGNEEHARMRRAASPKSRSNPSPPARQR